MPYAHNSMQARLTLSVRRATLFALRRQGVCRRRIACREVAGELRLARSAGAGRLGQFEITRRQGPEPGAPVDRTPAHQNALSRAAAGYRRSMPTTDRPLRAADPR